MLSLCELAALLAPWTSLLHLDGFLESQSSSTPHKPKMSKRKQPADDITAAKLIREYTDKKPMWWRHF